LASGFRILLRQDGRFDPAEVHKTLHSVRMQIYPHWTSAIVVDTPETGAAVRAWLASEDPDVAERVAVIDPAEVGV